MVVVVVQHQQRKYGTICFFDRYDTNIVRLEIDELLGACFTVGVHCVECRIPVFEALVMKECSLHYLGTIQLIVSFKQTLLLIILYTY